MSSTENVLNMRNVVSTTYQTLVEEIEVMGGETGGNDSGTAALPDETSDSGSDEDIPIPSPPDSGTAG